jgi:hypothetical protein
MRGEARIVEEGSGAVRPRLSFESRLRLVRVRHLVVHVVECMGRSGRWARVVSIRFAVGSCRGETVGRNLEARIVCRGEKVRSRQNFS